MTREIELSRIDSTLTDRSSPGSREVAADSFGELRDEIDNALPRAAVGEPYQSKERGNGSDAAESPKQGA